MATLHGFPILVTGQRWCVVDMPDAWAIMDSLDTVPTPAFQYQKDESGWRDAVAQLQRTDASPPVVPSLVVPLAPPPVRQGRRSFALARFGILFSAAILGVSAWLPWATIQVSLNGGPSSSERGDLFTIMSHGWRNSVADILVALAVIAGLQALVLPFRRISLASSIIGFLALVPVILGVTQIHTYTGSGFSHPPVSIGYGIYVAFGGCVLLMMAWAMFPTGLKGSRKRSAAPELGFPTPAKSSHVMEGLSPLAPPPPPPTTTSTAPAPSPAAAGIESGEPAKVATEFSGLPTLGAAMAQLAEHDRQVLVGTPSTPPAPVVAAPEPVVVAPVAAPEPVVVAPVVTEAPQELEEVESVAEPEPLAAAAVIADPEPVVTEPLAEPVMADVPEPVIAESSPIDSQPVDSGQEDSFPPGWYTDYADSSILRYWDGAEWTEHTHPVTADN
ncbi:MAG TPA: DUF2510 domain-containing protein [Acidimicrobiales bacterium]|jgi:hypothetical protein|nr:DUF2510 domain-containing protein [Acidimicrobiales bacterium]